MSFERVRDWEPLDCQRHICEIQGLFPAPQKYEFVPKTELKLTNLYRKPILSFYETERDSVRDWEVLDCQRHICQIQGLFPARKRTNLNRKSS